MIAIEIPYLYCFCYSYTGNEPLSQNFAYDVYISTFNLQDILDYLSTNNIEINDFNHTRRKEYVLKLKISKDKIMKKSCVLKEINSLSSLYDVEEDITEKITQNLIFT